ncbi:polysaccharide lyase [Stackebrandtia soli]|uniref:polysaccharide lyase n=1 Tax=Stackebrandtia soli TaxID=1892856 RepID=UPI0039E7A9BA
MNRRRPRNLITGTIVGVALLFIGGQTIHALAESPDGTVMRADYEDGAKNSGYADIGLNECCTPRSLQVVDLARTGDHAIRSQLTYGDAPVNGGVRAESHTVAMDPSYFDSGDTAYYGFSVYIVSHWQTDSREDIVFQWHNWPDACEASKVPSAFLTIQPTGQWRLRVNSDGDACSTPESIDKTSFDLGAVKPGQWNDFVFKFDWDHGVDGGIETWHQTSKSPGWKSVLSATGPNTFNDDPTTHGYLKWGIYKPAWNTAPTDVDTRVLIHDNVAIGDSFASVDPSVG